MTKKRLAIIIWVIAAFLFLIVGLATANARNNATETIGGSSTATDLPPPVETSLETPTETPSEEPAPKPVPRPAGPASFVMPDFTDMDENDIDTWMWDHNIDVSIDFDYGDSSGTDCEDAGDGIVEDQTPARGTRVKNSMSTDLYFSVYCDY